MVRNSALPGLLLGKNKKILTKKHNILCYMSKMFLNVTQLLQKRKKGVYFLNKLCYTTRATEKIEVGYDEKKSN